MTKEYFELFGVTCDTAGEGTECIRKLSDHSYDILLLDINLQEESGFKLCKTIREQWNLPILFISARQSDEDILTALNIGGDDYVKKPYTLSILLAKVKAMLKRLELHADAVNTSSSPTSVITDCDGLHLEAATMKANTIEQLVDNMFHATMEELETLKVEVTEESSLSIPDMFRDFQYFGNITLENSIPECLLCMDKLRLEQVIGNVIHNSYKYAGTSVTVRFWEDSKSIKIQIHDTGAGVPEEELALITEKFYRGSNTKGKSGSGLGLYLAKNFMERMEGALEYYNDHGFTVELYLKKV